jgi:ankyrin repeat protein
VCDRWDKPVELLDKYYTRDPAAVSMQDDKNGNFPIHIAAQNGFDTHVQLLLDHGADINAVNGKGNTALHMAWSYDYVSTAELLTDKGANVHQANDAGFEARTGIEGDKCGPIVYLLTAKTTENIMSALKRVEDAVELVEKGNFVSKCMAFKKKLAKDGLEIWTAECDARMKEVMGKLS